MRAGVADGATRMVTRVTPTCEVEVFVGRGVSGAHPGELLVLAAEPLDPHVAVQQAGPLRVDPGKRAQRPRRALRRHLDLGDAAVAVERDGLHARLPHHPRVVGGAVVEDVPPPVHLGDRAVVVPHRRVAVVVVDDDAAVRVWPHRRAARRVADRGGPPCPAHVCVDEVVEPRALRQERPLVEEVLLLGQHAVLDGCQVEAGHVRVQLRDLGRELAPRVVRLPVVVDEDRRVDLFESAEVDRLPASERPGGRVAHGDALDVGAAREAVIQVVLSVAEDGIRRVETVVAVGDLVIVSPGSERVLVQRPRLQVRRGQDVVSMRAVVLGALVHRAVDVHAAVGPDTRRRVGHEDPGR